MGQELCDRGEERRVKRRAPVEEEPAEVQDLVLWLPLIIA